MLETRRASEDGNEVMGENCAKWILVMNFWHEFWSDNIYLEPKGLNMLHSGIYNTGFLCLSLAWDEHEVCGQVNLSNKGKMKRIWRIWRKEGVEEG
jgi:hypothetical protein